MATAGQKAGCNGGEGAGEGDEDDSEPVVGPARRQPHAVEDDQQREVSQREALLEQKQVVRRSAERLEAAPDEQELAGEKEAEEQGGEKAAEDKVSPVAGGSLAQVVFDTGGDHSPANGISRYPGNCPLSRRGRFFANELTTSATRGRITDRSATRPARNGQRPRQSG